MVWNIVFVVTLGGADTGRGGAAAWVSRVERQAASFAKAKRLRGNNQLLAPRLLIHAALVTLVTSPGHGMHNKLAVKQPVLASNKACRCVRRRAQDRHATARAHLEGYTASHSSIKHGPLPRPTPANHLANALW